MAVTNEKGFKYAKLICVSDANNNKEYVMEQVSATEFKFAYGRVGGNMTTGTKSMGQWDKVYKDKTQKKGEASYKDVTHLFTESVSNSPAQVASNVRKYEEFKTGRPAAVKDFVKLLQSYANKSVQQNYKVEVANVTQAQVDQAQSVLDGVAKESQSFSNVRSVNNMLLELYATIPRKMLKVQDHLLSAEERNPANLLARLNGILLDEQKTLDVMAGQVALQAGIKNAGQDAPADAALTSDLLDAAGLDMEPVTSDEERMIRGMMADHKSKFKRAFKVTNRGTQVKYDANLKGAADKKTQLFWHGSRSENWWSIAQSGLLIRPSSAVYSGSMFGDGIYGADKFQKSLGYTSYQGSYWARGGEKRAFLALFEFHVGKQLVINAHNSECYKYSKGFLKQKGGYDSTFAKAGVSLHNNEYIVYDPAQCTIKYLIEIE